MSTATFTPGAHIPHPSHGATATGTQHSPHRLGNALRVVKVYAQAVFRVVVLGEYAEEAGVRRR
ncbi:hypothetical protein [Streptomyces sp.]|uniref:hypothetical protein n=1 Tax=Streptomyces sp. TaxID=1931 RepID=UPI002D79923C|nr:hypothetical protein [Streptomyces sp.]HET6358231.1 hypothetical protein [Streptomyces sp.]